MPSKRLTIEISDELQFKLQSIMPPNTLPTRKELITKLLEMVLEGVEEQGQSFLIKLLKGDLVLEDHTLYMRYTPGKNPPLHKSFVPKERQTNEHEC